jgi:2,3-diaminopropionate biosynthesis protein SbnB
MRAYRSARPATDTPDTSDIEERSSTMTGHPEPAFAVIPAGAVTGAVDGHRADCLDVIRRAYLAHAAGESVLPHSTFVRPDPPRPDRFIALPGYLGGEFGVAGMKWIGSYPDNVSGGLDRASAVLVLNDTGTGYPFAVMEGSVISATRTAASAVLAAEHFAGRRKASRVGIVGTGLIASHVCAFLRELGWEIGGYTLKDVSRDRAGAFKRDLLDNGAAAVRVTGDVADLFDECDLILLATTANTPYLLDPALLANSPVVLHLSLRDLGPNLIAVSQNVTDDVEHAVRERTSLHLTEQMLGNRDFVSGTIADLLEGRLRRDGRPAVYSPFGLGVLDLALGQWIYQRCRDHSPVATNPGFFPTPGAR